MIAGFGEVTSNLVVNAFAATGFGPSAAMRPPSAPTPVTSRSAPSPASWRKRDARLGARERDHERHGLKTSVCGGIDRKARVPDVPQIRRQRGALEDDTLRVVLGIDYRERREILEIEKRRSRKRGSGDMVTRPRRRASPRSRNAPCASTRPSSDSASIPPRCRGAVGPPSRSARPRPTGFPFSGDPPGSSSRSPAAAQPRRTTARRRHAARTANRAPCRGRAAPSAMRWNSIRYGVLSLDTLIHGIRSARQGRSSGG